MSTAPAVDIARSLRAVGPPDAPFRGRLVSGAPASYCVHARDAPGEIWLARTGGHVLAAVDVDTTDDGSTVLILPRLKHRITDAGTRGACTPGQIVTLAVSILRGGVEAQELGITDGEWWLGEDGRPLLVPGGGTPWQTTARDVLEALSGVEATATVVRRVIDALTEPVGFARAAPDLEDELFAAAAAEPLPLPAARDRPGVASSSRGAVSRPERSSPAAHEVTGAIERLVDADVARAARRALTATRAALASAAGSLAQRIARRPGAGAARVRNRDARSTAPVAASSKRRLWLVAAAVVATTLSVGLMWPEEGHDAEARAAGRTAPASEDGTETSGDGPTPERDTSGPPAPPSTPSSGSTLDDVAQAATVVDRLAECLQASSTACRSDVLERADAVIPPGIASAPRPRTVTVLDDLGDVLVVRVEDPSNDAPAQIVVLVGRDDERLVRDVYDVADQP